MKTIIFSLLSALALAFGAQAATVILAWDRSPDPGVSGYRIYEGGASHTYTNTVDAFNFTSVTVSNVIPSSTYYFAVTAYTTSGLESDFSKEVSYNVPLQLPVITQNPPGATTNQFGGTLTITALGTGGSFHWFKNSTTSLTNGGNISGVLTTTLTISNLSWLDNGTYSLQVSNAAGAVFSSGETVYVKPPAPTNIKVTGP